MPEYIHCNFVNLTPEKLIMFKKHNNLGWRQWDILSKIKLPKDELSVEYCFWSWDMDLEKKIIKN